jgi:hypothetical protein
MNLALRGRRRSADVFPLGSGAADRHVWVRPIWVYLNNQVGVRTASDIRAAGGDVLPTGNAANPNHVTVTGLAAEDANRLLTPTRPNPIPPKERLRR